MKNIIVFGAGGFIGHNLVKRLKKDSNNYVIGADIKYPEFETTPADEFFINDLRDQRNVSGLLTNYASKFGKPIDELYQLAADMGGAGYIFSGENDFNVISNDAQININTARYAIGRVNKIFFSSSACIYNYLNQEDPDNPVCTEESAYPAYPDSEYGWEKIFSERLYGSLKRNKNFEVRIARFHNIFGPNGSWYNGKEKFPAAICRKVIQAKEGGEIEIWGDGKQTRSFLYIDDCLDAIQLLMNSSHSEPINIGSEEMISINDLSKMVIGFSGKNLSIKNNLLSKSLGVRGRCSDNTLIRKVLNWEPKYNLEAGMRKVYAWIEGQWKEYENLPF